MYFLLNMGIFQPAMLVYQRVVYWLVVEPTHLKHMHVKLGSSSPNRDEHKKSLKPPPSIIPKPELRGFWGDSLT